MTNLFNVSAADEAIGKWWRNSIVPCLSEYVRIPAWRAVSAVPLGMVVAWLACAVALGDLA